MEKEFVTYEQAAALRDLGFNETCLGCYIYEVETLTWKLNYTIYNNDIRWVIAAPLKQQVFGFFREKYDMHHLIVFIHEDKTFNVGIGEYDEFKGNYIFHTYEEAENACIDKLIELVKQQQL